MDGRTDGWNSQKHEIYTDKHEIYTFLLRSAHGTKRIMLHFHHVAWSVALQPTAQLDARSVALHFNL